MPDDEDDWAAPAGAADGREVVEAVGRTEGKRERVPDFIDWVWRGREGLLARFPRSSAFIHGYGIYLLVGFFFLLFSALSIAKHMNFQSHGWDLGIFDQAVWQYSRFELGYSTVRLVPVLLADHWHPSLFLFAPFFWVWDDVRMLLVVQAAVVALGAVPVYWTARNRSYGRSVQLCAAFSYLFFWGLLELVFFDFHPHCLYPPVIALMYYFVDRDNMPAFFLTLPLLLVIQEQVVLTGAFIGVWLFLFRGKRAEGAATFLISFAWFFAASQKLIPGLAAGTVYAYNKYYEYLGGGDLTQAAKYLLFRPWTAAKLLFWPYHKSKLILALLLPFLFLPLAGPFVIIMLPDLLQRLYSSNFAHWELIRHYNAVYAAVLIIASMEALPRLHRALKRRYAGREIEFRKLAFAAFLVIALLQVPFTFSRSFKTVLDPAFWTRGARERTGYEALAAIPAGASVCAQDVVVPHLSHRERIYQYGCYIFRTDQVVMNTEKQYDPNVFNAGYVVLNKHYDCFPFPGQKELAGSIVDLYRDERYDCVNFGEGWLVFRLKPEYDIDGG